MREDPYGTSKTPVLWVEAQDLMTGALCARSPGTGHHPPALHGGPGGEGGT